MKTSVFTSISVMGALGLLTAIPAHALGLGNIELSSALNEPFKAEIPVNAVSGDEAETKLDLATAYIEMGDPEGAKSILKEIMAEGNDEQQSRATTLLNELT